MSYEMLRRSPAALGDSLPRVDDLRRWDSLTEAGREVLRELGTAVSPFSMEFEAMLRVFIAPLETKDQLIATLRQVHADAEDMLRFGGEAKQEFIDGINVTQDQAYIRALAVDFFISLLNTIEAWAERSLAEVETWEDLEPSIEKNNRGLEEIRRLPVDTPAEPLEGVAKPPGELDALLNGGLVVLGRASAQIRSCLAIRSNGNRREVPGPASGR